MDRALSDGREAHGSAAESGAVPAGEAGPLHRWYMLAILFCIYIMGTADRSVVSVVAEPLKHHFQLSDAQVGALGGLAYSLTFGLFVLPMGWLLDRVNRRVMLSLSVTIWSLLTMCGAAATSFVQLIVARMGVGAAESVSSPASFSMITDIFPASQRNTAVSIYYAGAPAGQIVIFILGGWLLIHFDWRAVFLLAGIPGLILAALLFFTGREPARGGIDRATDRPSAAPAAPPPTFMGSMRMIVARPALRNAMLGNMISSGVASTLSIWLTSFFVRIHGLPVAQAAIYFGLGFGVSMTVASFAVGPIADRYSRGDTVRLARIPALLTALAVIPGVLLALAPTVELALAMLVLYAILTGLKQGPAYALVLSLARPEIRGSTMGAAKLLVMLVGSGAMPLFTGMVSDAIGGPHSIRPAIIITLALLALSSLFFTLAGRAEKRERAAAG